MARTFVITGGGTGLGRAFARALAADGNRVVPIGRRLAKVEAVADEVGNGAFALACDITDRAAVDAAFAGIAERCDGKIDGLINNAATFTPFLIAEAPRDEVDSIVDTTLKGTIWSTRAAIPLLVRGGWVINVGSEGVMNRAAMLSVYQGVKWGLERFTRAMQAELGPQGIRVTLFRTCRMYEEDFEWNVPPERMKQQAEENAKRAWFPAKLPIASFASAGAQIRWLVNIPADVQVNEVLLKGRFP